METLQLNMEKLEQRKTLVLDLKKGVDLQGAKAQVVLCMDISVSMKHYFNDGTVQNTLERMLPLALGFDDDGSLDTYLFQTQHYKVPWPVTVDNCAGYVNTHILGRYTFGGTYYTPVLKAIFDDFTYSGKTNFLGMAKRDQKLETPVFVLFFTDGDNDPSDKAACKKIIKEMSAYGIFIQFVGIGRDSFPFLDKLDDLDGRVLDNAGFFAVPDLNLTTDSQLMGLMLKEFPSWYKLAKAKNMF